MSILIKGMEMPTDCTECWFRKTARHEYLVDCQICPFTGDTTPYTKRKDNCPLVPVPKHGRLIDADALMDEAYQPGAYGYVDAIQIENAPTIISAEEGE